MVHFFPYTKNKLSDFWGLTIKILGFRVETVNLIHI